MGKVKQLDIDKMNAEADKIVPDDIIIHIVNYLNFTGGITQFNYSIDKKTITIEDSDCGFIKIPIDYLDSFITELQEAKKLIKKIHEV